MEIRHTPGGRTYYVDHNLKITSFEDPRLLSIDKTDIVQHQVDFKRKMVYFRSQKAITLLPGQCRIHVNRETIFEDSYVQLSKHSNLELKKRLVVRFDGEQGLDYGGLSREYFTLLSNELFNPQYSLFEHAIKDDYMLQINPNSEFNEEHLDYFHFVGRIAALAVFHNRFLGSVFVPTFYKLMLDKPVVLEDMKIDGEYYRSLNWILYSLSN